MWSRTANWVLAGLYGLVILILTLGKPFFEIGSLWDPDRQRVREIRLIPFQEWVEGGSLFARVFETVGNLALFIPLGWMLAILLRRRVGHAIAWAALFSLTIELIQFAFGLGRTDITDVILNTAGAAIGVGLANLFPREDTLFRWLTLFAIGMFVVLLVGASSLSG